MNSKQNYQWETLSLGTCYCPEHWDKSIWKSDLDRMLTVGIKTVRIAEFACAASASDTHVSFRLRR